MNACAQPLAMARDDACGPSVLWSTAASVCAAGMGSVCLEDAATLACMEQGASGGQDWGECILLKARPLVKGS